MNKNKLADGLLVYDRYYGSKPSTVLLAAQRLLLCCSLCFCAMMYVLTEYAFNLSLLPMAVISTGLAVLFYLLFYFVKKRIAIPAMLLVVCVAVYFNYKVLWECLTYFWDVMMLMAEGRFIFPRPYLMHDATQLTSANVYYVGGIILGLDVMCAIMAFICALSTVKRIHFVPPIVLILLYCAPCLISERLEFNVWLIPLVAIIVAMIAISVNYRYGIAPTCKEYRSTSKREERAFNRTINRSGYIKRISMRTNYYAKYHSVGMAGAAIFAVSAMVASVIFPSGTAISYKELFDAVKSSFCDDFGVVASPFEEGPVSEYFSDTEDVSRSDLNIVSPGDGETDIIKVSFTGNQPVYLRGDIGVNFTGSGWTSLATLVPESWHGMLSEKYRPCELKMTRALLSASESESYADSIVSSENVRIEYLCETDVVFLPPYTGEFSYYDNNSFKIYGDQVVRVNRDSGSYVNAVECTALVPSYSNTEVTGDSGKIAEIVAAYKEQSMISADEVAATVLTDVIGTDKLITKYGEYVADTYLTIDPLVESKVAPFVSQMGLSRYGYKTAVEKYQAADTIAEFLRENYTYTTENINGSSDPVMRFLYDTKRGHCSLYASAMTLMLRHIGIPSRYCTGFYVISDNRYGDTTTLKEKNLHAWVEVYLGELGWVTFDPTSSSAFPNLGDDGDIIQQPDNNTQNEETSSITPNIPDRPSVPEQSSTPASVPSEAPVTEPEVDISNYIPFIIAAFIVLLVVVFIICFALWYRSLRYGAISAIGRMREAEPKTGAYAAYHCILKLLDIYGIKQNGGEMPVDFYKRADSIFGTKLESLADSIAALEFGGQAPDDQQRNEIVNELSKIYAKLLKRFKLLGNRIAVMRNVKKSI